jgi:hypothetical protein
VLPGEICNSFIFLTASSVQMLTADRCVVQVQRSDAHHLPASSNTQRSIAAAKSSPLHNAALKLLTSVDCAAVALGCPVASAAGYQQAGQLYS